MKTFAVEEEYLKNKDLKKNDVLTIQKWMKGQPHLPEITELETILFLHSCYYNQEDTKKTIETFYTYRAHYTDFFTKLNPQELQNDMDVILFQPLPEPTEDGKKIIFIKFLDTDASKFVLVNQMRILFMIFDLWLMQEGTAPGHIILADISNISFGHLMRLYPPTLKKVFGFLGDALPVRLKGYCFLNCVYIVEKALVVIKPFMSKKLTDVIYAYTKEDTEELYKFIPKKCLPADYGGQAPSVKELHEQMKQNLKNNAEYCKYIEETRKSDESKRIKSQGGLWWWSQKTTQVEQN